MPISVFLELITIFAIEIISRFIIDEFNLLVLKTHTPLAPPTLAGPSLPSIQEGCALVGSCLLSEPCVLGEAWLLTLQHTLYWGDPASSPGWAALRHLLPWLTPRLGLLFSSQRPGKGNCLQASVHTLPGVSALGAPAQAMTGKAIKTKQEAKIPETKTRQTIPEVQA